MYLGLPIPRAYISLFNTHLLNNIFWLLNFFFFLNIFVYFGFGCLGCKVQRRFFYEWTWIFANSTPRFKSIIGRKLPNVHFRQKKQFFAHFSKLIKEISHFLNSIFSKSNYKKKKKKILEPYNGVLRSL